MPSREGSNLRPLWRFCHTLNKQKVTYGTPPLLKDIKNEGRTGKVYENKGMGDKMPEQMSDICAELKPILQKIAGLESLFTVNCVFATGFVHKFTAKRTSSSASCLSTFSAERRSESDQPSPRGEGGGHAPPGLRLPKGELGIANHRCFGPQAGEGPLLERRTYLLAAQPRCATPSNTQSHNQ